MCRSHLAENLTISVVTLNKILTRFCEEYSVTAYPTGGTISFKTIGTDHRIDGKCSKHFNPPGPLFNVVFYLPSNLMNQSVSTYNSTLIGEGGGEAREYMDKNIYI